LLNEKVEEIKLSEYEVFSKSDQSPLTIADEFVQDKLSDFVSKTHCNNLISEEIKNLDYKYRKDWDIYWVIDPIDGTKEFISKGADYTINIALCRGSDPIFGLVSCPATKEIYYAFKGKGAFKGEDVIKVKNKEGKVRIVASKSHLNQETADFINEIRKSSSVEIKNFGSSLKICKIAEGKADIYPRFGPTMEWDTCAAQIIVEEAGGKVLDQNGKKLVYNKKNLLNPFFTVSN
tara:strand:+ start:518 stop:1219 length:702 start_codon:yes stop_codon:yes gene_type:complete